MALPNQIKAKHSVVNIKNNDNYSILYCLAAALRKNIPKINKCRKSNYDISHLKTESVKFPTPLNDVEKLEIQNSVKINVYDFDNGEMNIVFKSEKKVFNRLINLLVLNKNTVPHYVWISNLRNFTKTTSIISWLCKSCLNLFDSAQDFNSHLSECHDQDVIKVPLKIKSKKGLFKLNCNENTLQWSVTAALYPTFYKSGARCKNTTSYEKFYSLVNFPDINDMNIQEAVRMIRDNCKLNINIFIYEKGEIFPFIISNSQHDTFVDLLMLTEGNNQIFFIITDLSSLYSDRVKVRRKHFVCRRCLEIFLSQAKLTEHEDLCRNFKIQKTYFADDQELKFTNYRKQFEIPFVVYADFEVVLKPLKNENQTHEHIPIAVAYKLSSYITGETKKTIVYTGIDCVKKFIDDIINIYMSIQHYFRMNKTLKMTKQDVISFKNCSSCHICRKKFDSGTVKVRDHDHYTG